jgi:hypothetical protein
MSKRTVQPKSIDDEFQSNSRYKLAPISHAYRVQFGRDMKKFEERLALTIQRHREAHKANPTDHSKKQLRHFLSQRAGIRFLASMNQARRGLNGPR